MQGERNMILTKNHRGRRSGATMVETAFVLIPLMMFLMGIFEYGVLLMDWNLLINATQQGCRFALANNTDPTLSTDVQNLVTSCMAGRNTYFSNFTVTVSGTHQGVNYPPGSNLSVLSPGDPITVKVSGNYQFLNIIPMVSSPTVLPLSSSATMICEGGT
jgi:Flp pilus assembly protein TadG